MFNVGDIVEVNPYTLLLHSNLFLQLNQLYVVVAIGSINSDIVYIGNPGRVGPGVPISATFLQLCVAPHNSPISWDDALRLVNSLDDIAQALPKLTMHTVARYRGFTESYDYCTVCDKKDTNVWESETTLASMDCKGHK
jgi:hypothetical protein